MSIIKQFQTFIWEFYTINGRHFAWRNVENEYYVLISEIMLQQTQTHRVIKKFEEFLSAFPTIELLSQASLRDVLSVWQGLGYYRRARYLHQTAHIIMHEYAGKLPQDPKILKTFPGIGAATASSICAFAFNRPTIFIETNIRTVFIYHFFSNKTNITDKEIIPLIEQSVDMNNPREWYYALMDYGVFLKNQYKNPSRKSAHYIQQTKFEGSDRQIRAAILKLITNNDTIDISVILLKINNDKERIEKIIQQLENENFIVKNQHNIYKIV